MMTYEFDGLNQLADARIAHKRAIKERMAARAILESASPETIDAARAYLAACEAETNYAWYTYYNLTLAHRAY